MHWLLILIVYISQLHGYTHERFSALTIDQQRSILQKSITVLTELTGEHPKGFTAPYWSTGPELVPLLVELGILYDHSFMHTGRSS